MTGGRPVGGGERAGPRSRDVLSAHSCYFGHPRKNAIGIIGQSPAALALRGEVCSFDVGPASTGRQGPSRGRGGAMSEARSVVSATR